MRRSQVRALSALALCAPVLAMVAPATAAGGAVVTQSVSMTFAEPTHPALDCPGFPDVSCGSGEVVPFGQATDLVVFGAGCGGTCDLRTITLAGGSLVLDETVQGFTCQTCRPGPLEIGMASVDDVVVGGTGMFADASGTLSGTVTAAISNARPAGTAVTKLSGTISYDS